MRVGVFARGAKADEAKAAGADVVGAEERTGPALLVRATLLRAQAANAVGDGAAVRRLLARALTEARRERLRLPPPGAERTMRVVGEVLARCGYEPAVGDDGTMSLRSCPFHTLAQRDRDIVCGLNRELVDGVAAVTRGQRGSVRGIGEPGLHELRELREPRIERHI